MKRWSVILLLLVAVFLRGQEDSAKCLTLVYQVEYDYGTMDSMELAAMKLLEVEYDTVFIKGTKVYQKFLMQNGGIQHRVFDGFNEAMDLYIDHSLMRVNIYYRGLDFKSHFQRKVDVEILDSTSQGKFESYEIIQGNYQYLDGSSDEFKVSYLSGSPSGLNPDFHQIPGLIYQYNVGFMGAKQTFTLVEMSEEAFDLPEFVGFKKMTELEFMQGMREGQ